MQPRSGTPSQVRCRNPALYNLARQGLRSREFALIGFARADISTEQFREKCTEDIQQFATERIDPDLWHWFARRMYYVRGTRGVQPSGTPRARRKHDGRGVD